MTCILIKRGNFKTDKLIMRVSCEDEVTVQGDASTSQGTPKIASNHQKLAGRPGTDSPSQPTEVTNLVNTLILDFWPTG